MMSVTRQLAETLATTAAGDLPATVRQDTRRAILDLTADEMTHALGSVGIQAAGLWEFNAEGAMSKHFHAAETLPFAFVLNAQENRPGKAALNGVLSADLARAGFTGATRILEGERGFFAAMSHAHDPAPINDLETDKDMATTFSGLHLLHV